MEHFGIIAQMLTAIGLLLTGCSSSVNVYISWRNGKKVEGVGRDITTLKIQTDGISDKLLKVTGEAEHAKGVLQGAAEAQQNGH